MTVEAEGARWADAGALAPASDRGLGRTTVAPDAVEPRPLVVELVGPWGAGKSSIVRALAARDASVRPVLPVWSLSAPLLLFGGVQSLGTVVRLTRTMGRFPWKETRQLTRLAALFQQLETLRSQGGRAVVVEDGPALILNWLRPAGHADPAGGGAPSAWWKSAVAKWAKTVDIVVLLDAPHRVLAERVRLRAQANPFKDRQELTGILRKAREDYARVLGDLVDQPGPTVLSFRTDRQAITRITDDVLAAIDRGRGGR